MTEKWLPILLSAATALIALLALTRGGRRDNAAEAADRARLTSDVSYIRASVDDIKAESRATRADVKLLEGRVARAEASIASAHRRLNDRLGKEI